MGAAAPGQRLMSGNALALATASRDARLPALIAGAGEVAAIRFLEFFTVNIRNPNTRAAYGRAAGAFLSWCECRGIHQLRQVQPVHVATYIKQLGRERSAPTVKQHLACIRMLFDWLVTGQVIPSNPAHAVRGPIQKRHLDAFLCFCPNARKLRQFVLQSRALMRWQRAKKLGTWIDSTAASGFRFVAQFAKTLRSDWEAVKLSITKPWSNGPIEGHINRLRGEDTIRNLKQCAGRPARSRWCKSITVKV